MSRSLTPILVGTFRLLRTPAFHEFEAFARIAVRHSGERRSYRQWSGLLAVELRTGS